MAARTRPASCFSDFAIDALLAGELSAPAERLAREHADTCEPCRARLVETERARDTFAAEAPPLVEAAGRAVLDLEVDRRPARRRRFPAGAAASACVALAAAVLLFVGLHRAEDTFGERTKGRARLGIIVKRGERVEAVAPGAAVAAGDRLRFLYTSVDPTHLAVIGVDGTGRATIYVPQAATKASRAERVEAGGDVPLAATIELDETPGAETFYGVFCNEPVELEPIRLALESRAAEHRFPSCSVDRVVLEKDRP